MVEENKGFDKEVKMRLGYFACMFFGFILFFFAGAVLKSMFGLYLGLIICVIGLILFTYDRLFVESDYHIHDFGCFTTKIYDRFDEGWADFLMNP